MSVASMTGDEPAVRLALHQPSVAGLDGSLRVIGEVSAVRQLLGHTGLAEYVGDFNHEAEYRPER